MTTVKYSLVTFRKLVISCHSITKVDALFLNTCAHNRLPFLEHLLNVAVTNLLGDCILVLKHMVLSVFRCCWSATLDLIFLTAGTYLGHAG